MYPVFISFDESINRRFNNEVQHLGEQGGSCYPECSWEPHTAI
jgi:hypothetical protein